MAHAFAPGLCRRRQAAGEEIYRRTLKLLLLRHLSKYRGAGIARDVFEGYQAAAREKSERMKADLRAAVGAREPELRAAFERRRAARADSLAECRASGLVKWFLLRALEREFRGEAEGSLRELVACEAGSSVPALARAFEAATASALPLATELARLAGGVRRSLGAGEAEAGAEGEGGGEAGLPRPVALRVGGKRCLAVRRRTREAGPPDAAGAQA
eukprot:tig00000940_g5556.t1